MNALIRKIQLFVTVKPSENRSRVDLQIVQGNLGNSKLHSFLDRLSKILRRLTGDPEHEVQTDIREARVSNSFDREDCIARRMPATQSRE
ncbi:MAG: hypothetical protein BWY44_01105 [Candidatus Omnitrophica bacterium ADurb.Bin292]|nr:MAG: hypothetical protein BWY44_01105 [Candidatus Omnitrophica bacterium ADurb.Bin292]